MGVRCLSRAVLLGSVLAAAVLAVGGAGAGASAGPSRADVWFVGYDIDVCGVIEPPLHADASAARSGFVTHGNGIITVAPRSASQTGAHATLGAFVRAYLGMSLSREHL